jgi:hypothetical protein
MPRGIYDRVTRDEPRADGVRRERRKKPGQSVLSGINLAVNQGMLEPDHHHRWVNDKGGRVQQMHREDWDVVQAAASDEPNEQTTIHAGVDEGKPFNHVLMRKPKDWYEADKKEKERPLDEMEDDIRRGRARTAELKGDGVYTPGENKIERVTR